jgi:riboflavin kinase/FMN adenylyltransferase
VFRIIQPNNPFPSAFKRAVLAIGNFDGVHCAHQAVLAEAINIAARENCPALALTFEPHPRFFFQPDNPIFCLTGVFEKNLLFEVLGLSGAVFKRFDASLAAMTGQDFFNGVLIKELDASHLIVGEGFHFGKNRAGTPELLQDMAQSAGIGLSFIAPQRDATGALISSSHIRSALAAGDIVGANRLLGYRWFVTGQVQHGDKRGRALGIPTANIALPENCRLKHGVYAGRAQANGFWFGAALHFGRRVQFGGGAPLLEAHLFDFSGELYGKTLRIEFMDYLREEEKFADSSALKLQMQKDVEKARAIVLTCLKRPQNLLQSRLDGMTEPLAKSPGMPDE